jgi:hypothetical protein
MYVTLADVGSIMFRPFGLPAPKDFKLFGLSEDKIVDRSTMKLDVQALS